MHHQFVVAIDFRGRVAIVFLEKTPTGASLLRPFEFFEPSLRSRLSVHSRPSVFEDSENEELLMLRTGDRLCLFNFEKALEERVVDPHSLLLAADADFLRHSRSPGAEPFAELLLPADAALLSKIKFFKVGLLALCFENGTLAFFREAGPRALLEFKVG